MTRSYWTEKQDQAYENACIHFAEHGEIRIGNSLDYVDINKSDVIEKMLESLDESAVNELIKCSVGDPWPSAAKFFNVAGKVREEYLACANELIADAITDYVEPR